MKRLMSLISFFFFLIKEIKKKTTGTQNQTHVSFEIARSRRVIIQKIKKKGKKKKL